MDKGTIIAYGGGFDRKDTFKAIVDKSMEICGLEHPRMLFLPTAHKDILEAHEDKIEAYAEAGCDTHVLLISKESQEKVKEEINKADIIYATGGNLKFLTENWRQKGAMDELRKAYARGAVLVGVSSGAMCWAERGYDNCGEHKKLCLRSRFPFIGVRSDFVFLGAVGIIPFCLCPHFDNLVWRKYANEAAKLDIPSVCIENGAAIIYSDQDIKVLLDNPKRKVYLFSPSDKIFMKDVTNDLTLFKKIDAQRKALQ